MKYLNIIWVCVVLVFGIAELSAQTPLKMKVRALIVGPNGQPLPGAVIKSEIDGVTATSDSTGMFSIEVTPNAVLSVATADYATKLITAGPDLKEISLGRKAEGQTVNIAYRTVEQSDLIGGVSTVNVSELLDKNYFTYSLSNMEGFVGGFNGNLWGMNEYLLLVDGVPRDAGSVMPTEIDQITFLKGVSAVALYGSRAAKGVVMITTKRGKANERKVSVRANSGVHLPKSYPKFLGSAEYMTLYNEAIENDGLGEKITKFTDEEIYYSAAGTNPYRYPDVDYYSSDYLKKAYGRYDATVEITGGNERARYYTNMGYYSQGTLLNFGEAVDSRDQRVHVRGNVDMDLNDFITAKVDAAAIYYSGIGVNTNYWQGAATLRPNRFTPLIPIDMLADDDETSHNFVKNSDHLIDGKYLLGGTQSEQTNPIADIYAGGTNTYNSRQFQFNSGINADLNKVLKGLSFQSLFGIDYSTTYSLAFRNDYAIYMPSGHSSTEPAWNDVNGVDQITTLTKYGQDASSGEQSINGSWYRQTLSFSGILSYQNQVNRKHNFSALLVAGGFQQAISAAYHRRSNANLGLYTGYNFKGKYYLDFNGALVHSAKLPEDNRRAFSPTLSAGWRISNEPFMAGVSSVNNLKLSVSAGILHTDLDIDGYYLYDNLYRQTDGAWYTWRDGLQNQSTDVRRSANPDMVFPKREEVSVGLDVALFNNSIVFNGSAFVNQMTGVVTRNNALYPSYFVTVYPETSFLPYTNYNNDQRMGVDFNLDLNENFGQVKWTLGVAGTYYTTKAVKRAEIYEDAYQKRQGRPLDAIWGLESLGFFVDETDIENSPGQLALGETSPGDIKYKDQNGDGVINNQDQVFLGRYGSPLTMGVHLTASWKNFTLFALGVSRVGGSAMKRSDYFRVNGDDKYSEVVRDRWTEETKNTATYPRLTTLSGDNNFRDSDFWMYSTNRFELARVQLSYTISINEDKKSFFREFGVYVNGSNLLTIAPDREILELSIGSSPQTRFFNLGVKALF